MGSFMPMFDARRRTDFVYEPLSVYGGKHDYLSKYQNSVISPHAHSHYTTNSSPIIVDDATIEWKETPEAHIFKTLLPAGVRREDVKVQVEDDQVLKISGERVMETEDRHSNWHHLELSRGKFLTALKLPEDARVDLIKSYWENGALTVRIPRKEVAYNHHHHVRNVEINNHY